MATKPGTIIEALDHPVVFIFFVTIAVCGMASLLTWGAKTLGWSGPAALFQHP